MAELQALAAGLGHLRLSALKKADLVKLVGPYYDSSAYIPTSSMKLIKDCMVVLIRNRELSLIFGEAALEGLNGRGTHQYVHKENVLSALLSDPNRRCTKKTLMTVLGLKEGEVEAFPCDTVPNPYYRSAAPMKLYSLQDAIKAAVRQFGSWSAVIAHREAKNEAAAQKRRERKEAKARVREKRKAELLEAFRPCNLKMRHDSRLIDQYLNGVRDFSARELATIMDEMRFYYRHADYGDFFQEHVDAEMEHRGRFDRDEISDQAQDEAVEEWARSNIGDLETAMEHLEFPPSLRNMALDCRDSMRRQ